MPKTARTGDVFVPGRLPTYTYNPRAEFQLEAKLDDYLQDGGAILALVGPTKTGKSVLLKRVLTSPIWLDGQGIKSVDNLWDLVGTELGVAIETQLGSSVATEATATVKARAILVEGGGDFAASSGKQKSSRIVSATATAVKAALIESGRPLVIDDFHFIDRPTQQELVRAVKPLVFDGLRVVFAAISHRKHDVVTAVEDMVGRVEPLEIETWTEAELLFIALKGFEQLGVLDQDDRLGKKLASMSFGSPHIMQKLCRELVRGVNGIGEARSPSVTLSEPSDWDEFFRSQVEEASGRWFTKLLRGPQEKGKARATWALDDGRELDSYGLVLKAVGDSGPLLELSRDEIRRLVEAIVPGKPPEANQVTRALQHMGRLAAKSLLEAQPSEEELDASPEIEFHGVQPVIEFVGEGPNSTLHIADPFFAYYLRWGADRHLAA